MPAAPRETPYRPQIRPQLRRAARGRVTFLPTNDKYPGRRRDPIKRHIERARLPTATKIQPSGAAVPNKRCGFQGAINRNASQLDAASWGQASETLTFTSWTFTFEGSVRRGNKQTGTLWVLCSSRFQVTQSQVFIMCVCISKVLILSHCSHTTHSISH